MVKLIFIEGNVASGKSTLVEHLKKLNKNETVTLLTEPVDHWQDILTQPDSPINLLQDFYQDIPKYSFCFQAYAFLSRMQDVLQALEETRNSGKQTLICERSVFTDKEIFFQSLYEDGNVTRTEKAVYEKLWRFWIGLMKPYFHDVQVEFLYVRCDPEKNLKHLRSRSRAEEENVQIDYLQKLHSKHERLYGNTALNGPLAGLLPFLLTDPQNPKVHTLTNLGDRDEFLSAIEEWVLMSSVF